MKGSCKIVLLSQTKYEWEISGWFIELENLFIQIMFVLLKNLNSKQEKCWENIYFLDFSYFNLIIMGRAKREEWINYSKMKIYKRTIFHLNHKIDMLSNDKWNI